MSGGASNSDCFDRSGSEIINIQVFVCDYNIQKCWQFRLMDTVWHVKQTILASLPKDLREGFNYGLFLPPCNGRAGKFLLEERPLKDYPFQDCVPYLEFKYKKRVYKMLNLDEKLLKLLHSKHGFKKFLDNVDGRNVDKIEKLCSQGFDPNFHNLAGETPLTLAAVVPDNSKVLITLVAGGAHLDFRSLDNQTALHKAACLPTGDNVKTLLSLGASPNCRDGLNLTPLYHCLLNPKSCPQTADILLRDYSDIGVMDIHGNQEVHQACKHGLSGHLEHLLFYGADFNCRNANGNTPLHVCAVNNQESCARILLFRGADPTVLNNQGQTAYHVANFVGHVKVAEVIRAHASSQTVPYRGQPRYNSKRRIGIPPKRGSLNSNTGCYDTVRGSPATSSYAADHYGSVFEMSVARVNGNRTVPNEFRPAVVQSLKETIQQPRPLHHSQSCAPSPAVSENSYACQDRFCDDTNIPRILVIPRSKKGFGFILRGAKKIDPNVNFQPTLEMPAMQYFEGVDTNGMAMKAGLKPGDFLLEINNVDVRCASHDQVVRLIQMASDTITLKVITVDLHNNVRSHFGTMSRAMRSAIGPDYFCHQSHDYRLIRTLSHACNKRPNERPPLENGCYGSVEQFGDRRHQSLSLSKSVDNLPASFRDPSVKVASIRNRSSHRRVSVTEIEQLMQRHNGGCANMSSTSFEQQQYQSTTAQSTPSKSGPGPSSPGPRVYASVAEMKRQKKQILVTTANKPPQSPAYRRNIPNAALDSSTAGAEMYINGACSNCHEKDYFDEQYNNGLNDNTFEMVNDSRSQFDAVNLQYRSSQQISYARLNSQDDYCPSARSRWSLTSTLSEPYRPPLNGSGNGTHEDPTAVASCSSPGRRKPSPPPRLSSCSSSVELNAALPPPPVAVVEPARVVAAPPPPPPPPPPADMGKMVESVTFKKALAQRRAAMVGDGESQVKSSKMDVKLQQMRGPVDFESDLKSAIARRRACVDNSISKSTAKNDSSGQNGGRLPNSQSKQSISSSNNSSPNGTPKDKIAFNTAIKGSATSLKESVENSILMRKNAENATGANRESRTLLDPSQRTIATNPSPPQSSSSGAAGVGRTLMKLDSGYTSSRNSLVEQHNDANCSDANSQRSSSAAVWNGSGVGGNGNATAVVVFELSNNSAGSSNNDDSDSVNGDSNKSASSSPQSFYKNGRVVVQEQSDMLRQNRVTVLSQKLEENISGPQITVRTASVTARIHQTRTPCCRSSEQDSMSLASTLSSSLSVGSDDRDSPKSHVMMTGRKGPPTTAAGKKCTERRRRLSNFTTDCTINNGLLPEVPPPDYDLVDSGTGDSDPDEGSAGRDGSVFSEKLLMHWSNADVSDWLDSMRMGEYKVAFSKAGVDGHTLLYCDRTEFTKLGVTRVAHRIAMENSLRQFKQEDEQL